MTVPTKKRVRLASSVNGAPVSLDVTDSARYRGFLFQIEGFANPLAFEIQASLDGTNYQRLDPGSFVLPTVHFSTASRMLIKLILPTAAQGGLRLVSLANNDGTAGVVTVNMFMSAYSNGLSEYS